MQNVSELKCISRKVSLRPLKQFAAELPAPALLREILLTEPDELDSREFLGRLPIWLQLSRRSICGCLDGVHQLDEGEEKILNSFLSRGIKNALD